MTDNIKLIFTNNISLLEQADKAICYFREQRHDIALGIIADSMGLIRSSIEAVINNKEYFNLVSTDPVLDMLSGILEAYKTGDYILLADLLELQLISFIIGVQELIIGKEELPFRDVSYDENISLLRNNSIGLAEFLPESIDGKPFLREGYRVEFSSCGLMTLAARNKEESYYFHTNGRISAEAFMLARHWYNKDVKRYIIYGLAFGYHIKELLAMADQAEIIVYEEDLNVILLAGAFTRLKDLFDTGRVKLVYDPKLEDLRSRINNMQKGEAFYVHYPSYQNSRCEGGRKLLKNYVSWSKAV
jgi:hypothetical protein